MGEKASKDHLRSVSTITRHKSKQEGLFDPAEVLDIGPFHGTSALLTAEGGPATQESRSAFSGDGTDLSTASADPFGCFVLNNTGSIVHVDVNGARLAQTTKDELMHAPFLVLVSQDSRTTFLAHFEGVIETGEAAQCEISFLRRDGYGFDARVHSSPAFGKDPDQRVYCIVTDISQQRRLLDVVRESEERYRTVTEYSSDGIAILREGNRFLYANPAILAIFGCESEAELLGRHLEDFVIPLDRERMTEINRMIHRNECTPCRFEFRGLKKDGTIVHIEALGTRTVYRGEPAGLMWLRDVGERIRAEDERRRLALIVEQAVEMILVTDRSGILQYANVAFLRLTGKRREEVIGMRIADLAIQGEDKTFFAALGAKLQRERRWNGRLTMKRPGGGSNEFEVNVSPMRDQLGVVTNNVISCRDVTTESILEEQLRQAHKMEAIGTLAGGIAHDFNNILAAIIGNAELALDEIPKESTVYRNLEQIFKASQRAKDLIRQILAFSRRDHQEPVLVHAGPLIVETMKLLRSSIPATIDMRHRIETEKDTILADAGRLQQILMNLCSNAAHAMREEGGLLEVTARECKVGDESSAAMPDLKPVPYFVMEVKDTGHGIPRGVLDRIFDPFFTTKRPGEGTGMGLAVVHGIVKSLNGAIAVASTPGIGSVFTVYLPIVVSPKQQSLPREGSDPPGGKEHILFVDDEPAIVEMNSMILKRLGYKVTAATSSVEALALFTHTPQVFDLVITDVTMPELTGAELAKRLRAIRSDIPIILVTGFSETVNAENARKMGIDRMLMKPLVKRELTEAIRKVLDSRKKEA